MSKAIASLRNGCAFVKCYEITSTSHVIVMNGVVGNAKISISSINDKTE